MPMHDAAHPGEILREWMGEDVNVSQLANHLHVSRVTLSKILNGASGVTAVMALRLAEAFPATDARLWMNLQTNYELAKALREERISVTPVRAA